MATIRVNVLDCDVRRPGCEGRQREDANATGLLIKAAAHYRADRRTANVKNIFICGFCLSESNVRLG